MWSLLKLLLGITLVFSWFFTCFPLFKNEGRGKKYNCSQIHKKSKETTSIGTANAIQDPNVKGWPGYLSFKIFNKIRFGPVPIIVPTPPQLAP